MSMKFAGRDFDKEPLTRACTQIFFDPDNEDEAPFRAQQHHNIGGKLDTTSIVANYYKTGVITHTRDAAARYIDATVFTDFADAMMTKLKADEAFDNLPDHVKKEFNSQQEFVEFALNPNNLDKLREWGLASPLKTLEQPAEPAAQLPT